MRIVGYCVRGTKEYVAYDDSKCKIGEIKVSDGFHDKTLNIAAGELSEYRKVEKWEINLERILKRLRGTRCWHPLLQLLREEVAE